MMEGDKLVDTLIYEYLTRKEKNAAAIFKLNCGPVRFNGIIHCIQNVFL